MFKKLKQKKILIIAVLIPLIYLYFRYGIVTVPIEQLALHTAFAFDIAEGDGGNLKSIVIIAEQNFLQENKRVERLITVSADTIAQAREPRQQRLDKKFLIGQESIMLFSEAYSRHGISDVIDAGFKSPLANNASYISICKGNPQDILSIRIPGHESTSDYVNGMIEHSREYSFSPDNYKFIDIFVRMKAEGRSLVLPYIEIVGDHLELTGTALFKHSKMVQKLDTESSKYMNLLRDSKVRGILSIKANSDKYVDFYGQSSRKVDCTDENGEYVFTINLKIKGDIISNTIYPDPMDKAEVKKLIEGRLSKEAEKNCYDFIKRMQKDYKVDCLELGQIAAAKYGRNTDTDWDEAVRKSKIIVNVDVTIESNGRGDY
jgi:Ger(x)C family germination protein